MIKINSLVRFDQCCLLYCWSTAEKYCSLVEEEGGLELLKALLASPVPYQRIKALARVVITQCEHFKVCVSFINCTVLLNPLANYNYL